MGKWLAKPQSVTVGKSEGAKAISVNAAGAVSYLWKKNGEKIAGGEDGELTVEWTRCVTTDVYTATPVYDIFGSERKGEPIEIPVQSIAAETTVILN